MFTNYISFLKQIGIAFHFSESQALMLSESIAFLTILVAGILLYFIVVFIIKKTLYIVIKRSTTKFDDLLVKNKVITRLCLLIPAIVIRSYGSSVLPDFEKAYHFFVVLTRLYEICVYTFVVDAIVNAAYDFYNSFEMSKMKPIKGFVQTVKIVLFIFMVLLIIATLLGKKVGNIVIGLGTLSAVLMLIFKDPILGFVGSIQLSINDMVRIGDWIVVSGNGADGVVQEINLTTVKVQNFDNTITTIPTYSLVSNSFTNWRGMADSGGRRIMRSVNIDVDTIRFCTPEMLEKYKKFQLVKRYIEDRQVEIEAYNKDHKVDTSILLNGRRQTNFGIFRAYVKAYLENNPNISKDLVLMVRQLQPTDTGIPLQIYAFSTNKQWTYYEDIQSDLFDHIFAVIPMFDLKIYQRPSSYTAELIAQEVQDFILNKRNLNVSSTFPVDQKADAKTDQKNAN
jgi:Small-conductance mechanosensitive channel